MSLGGIRTSDDDVKIVRVDYKTRSYSWTNLPYYTKYKIEISTLTYRGYGPKAVLYPGKNGLTGSTTKLTKETLLRKHYASYHAMFPCLPTTGNFVADTKFASQEVKRFPTNSETFLQTETMFSSLSRCFPD